jgi:hypothetical protein
LRVIEEIGIDFFSEFGREGEEGEGVWWRRSLLRLCDAVYED